jgi:hypothetical protein
MLILKFTCDDQHHLNSKLVAEKFVEAVGKSKDIVIKDGSDVVKLYLGQKQANNISLNIEITDEDVNGAIM